jgi:hypothetical protein
MLEPISVPDDAASISSTDSDADSSLSGASTASTASSSTSDSTQMDTLKRMFHTLFNTLSKNMQDFYIGKALAFCKGRCESRTVPPDKTKDAIRKYMSSKDTSSLMGAALNTKVLEGLTDNVIKHFEFPVPKMSEEVLSLPLLEMFNATRLLSENKSNTIGNTLRYDHKYQFSVERIEWDTCKVVNKITSHPGADTQMVVEFSVDELKQILLGKNLFMGTNYSRIILGGILIKPYVANNLTPNILKLSFSLPGSSVNIDMTFDKTKSGVKTTTCEFRLTDVTGGNIQQYKWTCEIENLQFYYTQAVQAGGKKRKYRKYKTRRVVSALGKYRSRRNRNTRSLRPKNKYKNKTKTKPKSIKKIKKNKNSL